LPKVNQKFRLRQPTAEAAILRITRHGIVI
jgi:hypothetical protein